MTGRWVTMRNEADEEFRLWLSPTMLHRLGAEWRIQQYIRDTFINEFAMWRARKQ